jgi:hypothetical protein
MSKDVLQAVGGIKHLSELRLEAARRVMVMPQTAVVTFDRVVLRFVQACSGFSE